MATIKAVLWKQVNKEGKLPIKIRITKNGKPRYVGVGFAVRESEWNAKKCQVKSSVLEHQDINDKIRLLLTRAQQAENEMLMNDEVVTARKLKMRTKSKTEKDFFGYADRYIEILFAQDKYRTAKRKRSALNKFKAYAKSNVLDFSEITV